MVCIVAVMVCLICILRRQSEVIQQLYVESGMQSTFLGGSTQRKYNNDNNLIKIFYIFVLTLETKKENTELNNTNIYGKNYRMRA